MGNLCRLSIGPLNISQKRRKYKHSVVATKERKQFASRRKRSPLGPVSWIIHLYIIIYLLLNYTLLYQELSVKFEICRMILTLINLISQLSNLDRQTHFRDVASALKSFWYPIMGQKSRKIYLIKQTNNTQWESCIVL